MHRSLPLGLPALALTLTLAFTLSSTRLPASDLPLTPPAEQETFGAPPARSPDPLPAHPAAAHESPQPAPPDKGWWPGLKRGVGFAVLLLLTSGTLSWRWRRRERTRATGPATPHDRFAAGVLCAALLSLAFMLARFRFGFDDFFLLQRAARFGFVPDDSLRVALAGLFHLGLSAGGATWPFWVTNGAAAGTWLFLTWRALREVGLPRGTGLLCVALVAVAPGVFELVRWGAGFQQLASMAIVLGILNAASAFARAAAGGQRARAIGLALLAAGLGAIGVFVKYPTMAMVPVAAFSWAALVARSPCSPRQAAALGLAIALGIGVPFALAHLPERGGELAKVGSARLVENVGALAHRLSGPLVVVSLVAGAMWLARRMWAERGAAPPPDTGARAPLVRRQGLGLLAAAGAVSVPYLLNARYFASYYAILPWVMISPLAAELLARLARGPRAQLVGLAVFVLALQPQVHEHTRPSVFNDVERRLREVSELARGRAPATRIALTTGCEDPADEEPSRRELAELLVATEGDAGFWWATGWADVGVEIVARPEAAQAAGGEVFVLLYCRGSPLRTFEQGSSPPEDEPES